MYQFALLLVGALATQGDLKMTLDQAVFPAPESGSVLELSYDIPYTSLTFLREAGEFKARFEIGVQVTDAHRQVVAGDVWQREIDVTTYDPTMAKDSSASGSVNLNLPPDAANASVQVSDRANERTAEVAFHVERASRGILVKLLKAGQVMTARKYGLGDTLEALAQVLVGGDSAQSRPESLRFAVTKDGRVVTGATVACEEGTSTSPSTSPSTSSRTWVAVWSYAIADSSGVARLGGADYLLEVSPKYKVQSEKSGVQGSEMGAHIGFRVDVPFFYDDDVYMNRVAEMLYVATTDQMNHLRSVPRADREKTWNEFWKKRDPSPTTDANEHEDEYFQRIDYAIEHFGQGDRGYKSDRGKVYVLLGAPDQVEQRPFDVDSPASETWYYYESNRTFVFVDKFGAGEFVLQNPQVLPPWE
jgi:GWxTD domain-containing protein